MSSAFPAAQPEVRATTGFPTETTSPWEKKTVILGLGNTLLGDEGVGVHAVRYFQAMLPGQADIEFIDGGTLSFTLVEAIEAAEKLIVIDAAELRCVPGMVRLFQGEEMDGFVGTSKKSSVHEVSLADLLVISHLTGHLPKYRALIGIQPGTIVWSETLSEPVDKAIRSAYELISELLLEWRTAGGAIARRQDPSA